MTTKTFFANFGHLADAPNGVKKMRELILQLAVQGKLVPQDPNDEPASVLLERVLSLKQHLVKQNKLRKTKNPMPYDGADQVEVPPTWVYTKLYDIGEIAPRNEADERTEASFVPMPLISEFYGVPLRSEIKSWGEIRTGFTHFAEGDVCLAKITPCYQNGKSAVMRGLRNGIGAGTTELHIFRPLEGSVVPEYVLVFLKSPLFINEGIPRMTGSAGQKRITRDYFAGKPFPLPPLAEQKRIVAKVDQLMALCDELETRQKKQQQGRVRLNHAALDKLFTAREPEEFAAHWQRISTNFDLLYDHPETIAKLRAAILQLAVQGKLVPQDPNDEPASDLLERIRAEKERLVKEGKVRKSAALPIITDAEKPFELPIGWAFVRFGNITNRIGSGSTPRGGQNAYVNSGVPFLRSQNVWNHGLELGDVAYITEETHEKMSNTVVFPNDILLNITGASLGRCTIFPNGIGEANVSQHVTIIRPTDTSTIAYLHLCILSPYTQALVWGRQVGMAREGLSKKVLELFEIPLPPLAEQRRIVAKVDQIMDLCDELETKLNQAQQHSKKLMEATVRQLLVV